MEKDHIEKEFARINAAGSALIDYGISRLDVIAAMMGFIIHLDQVDGLTAYFADFLDQAIKTGRANKPTLNS